MIVSSSVVLVGSFYLVKAVVISTRKDLAMVAMTYIEINPYLEKALSEQKADGLIGFIFSLFFWGGISCPF